VPVRAVRAHGFVAERIAEDHAAAW
jgi:hypothetical protein